MAHKLTVTTLNIQGHSDSRLNYIGKLAKSYDFILVQEHWLRSYEMCKLLKYAPHMRVHGVSQMSDGDLLEGRPYGGCAILWNSMLSTSVTPLQFDNNRACGVTVNDKNYCLNIYCMYLPNDRLWQMNDPDFGETLSAVQANMSLNDTSMVIIGGDFNTDFGRINSVHTEILSRFIADESLIGGLDLPCADVNYTFESKANGSRSVIDHILFSQNIGTCVEGYHVLHDCDNCSDHSLLISNLNMKCMTRDNMANNDNNSGVMWNKASKCNKDEYRSLLDLNLKEIAIPSELKECSNLHCVDPNHHVAINALHDNIVHAMISAGEESIPLKGRKKHKVIPGWTEIVKEERETSLFWHRLWLDNDCPRHGIVADIRRRSRLKYHYAIRKARKSEKEI